MTSTSELIDAKVGAAEARWEARLAQLLAPFMLRFDQLDHRLDLMNQRIDHLDGRLDQLTQRVDKLEHQVEQRYASLNARIWGAASLTITLVIGSMVGIIAILATVMPWSFDAGASIQDRVSREVAAQVGRR